MHAKQFFPAVEKTWLLDTMRLKKSHVVISKKRIKSKVDTVLNKLVKSPVAFAVDHCNICQVLVAQ